MFDIPVEILGILMGSAVISAIISGLFGYVGIRREQQLTYITGERAKWREAVREILKVLGNNIGDSKTVLSQLREIGSLINPYGQYEMSKDTHSAGNGAKKKNVWWYYLNDGHIWKIIHYLENDIRQGKAVNTGEVEKLRKYLSLLLKHDWERAKQEITGNRLWIVASIINLCGSVFFVGGLVRNYTLINENPMTLLLYTIPLISIMILPKIYVVGHGVQKRNVWIGVMLVIVGAFFVLFSIVAALIKSEEIGFAVGLFAMAFMMAWEAQNKTLSINNKYIKAVSQAVDDAPVHCVRVRKACCRRTRR